MVPLPAFRSAEAMLRALPELVRNWLVLLLVLVASVPLVRFRRTKFVLSPMPPEPAFSVISFPLMSSPVLSPVTILPVPEVAKVASPVEPASS